MNFNSLIIKILWLGMAISCYQIKGTIKTFVNDSSKIFIVRVYDNNNNVISIKLAPGAIQDLFIPGNNLDKIVVQDEKHTKKALGSMTRQILRKETSKINDNMVFIIHQDSSIKMFQGTTGRNETLRNIDTTYIKTGTLPTIEMAIVNIKTDQPWIMQNITYSIKYNKSFLESIESLFS